MKGYFISGIKKLKERELEDNCIDATKTKVRITNSLISFADVLRYRGELPPTDVIIGKSSVGVVYETSHNLFDIEKGKRVYIDPFKECEKCYNCINGEKNKCTDLLSAGEDYNGYLCDFAVVNNENLFTLPNSVSDFDALFIDKVALAIKVIDQLNVQNGDYVAIIGANNFGIILAQLLIYYSAVPVVITNDKERYQIAKDSGIYYVLGEEDNWQKEVSQMTGGRMADKIVYIADCDIPVSKAFPLASVNSQVAFTGLFYKNNPISFMQAIKKQLNIMCINNGFGNTSSAINLISNKAVKFSTLKFENVKFEDVPSAFKKASTQLDKEQNIKEIIVSYS